MYMCKTLVFHTGPEECTRDMPKKGSALASCSIHSTGICTLIFVYPAPSVHCSWCAGGRAPVRGAATAMGGGLESSGGATT